MQVVVGHANPDFDAYAATIAAVKLYPGAHGVYLGSQNRNVREFHALHQDLLDFVELKRLDLGAVDRLVMVDTREPSRIGELGDVARDPDVEVVVYDHHPPSDGDIQDAEDRSMETGATTSILVHEIMDRGVEVTPLEATALLLGIHEDTGSLTYPNSTAFDAEAAAYLMSAGADLEVVAQFLSRVLMPEQRALLDALLGDLHLWDVHGQEIAVGYVALSEYVDSASVVTHYLCEDMGYRVVVAAMVMPDRLYVVGRSRIAEVDIAAVLSHVGGGGHSQAASASMHRMPREEVLGLLRRALEAEVRPPLTAGEIGSAPVRTVTSDTPMSDAGELMGRWGHGGLPVVDDEVLVGIVTRKDVDKASRHGLEHAPVKGFMGVDVVTVPPDTGLDELERLLTRESIGRVPVVEGRRISSIVTRKDVLRAKHGDAYLDRGLPQVGSEATERFLASVEQLLPGGAREMMRELGHLAEDLGDRAHVVGGFVRDMLLGRPNLDIDIVVEGDGVAFAEAAAERMGGRVVVHRRFGTAVLVLGDGRHVDVTSARTEYYTRPGALPTVEASSLRQDLLRRDFSINAMAACVNPACFGAIADPFGGLRDLEQGSIRVLHSLSFVEDPTRVFRAARFEQRYGFTIEPSTDALARRCTEMGLLDEVSGARIREELFEILDEERVVPPLARLEEFGALASIVPEGVSSATVLEETGSAESSLAEIGDAFTPRPERRLALLCAFSAQASSHEAERWARWLRLGRSWIEALVGVAADGGEVLRRLDDARSDRASGLYRLLEPFPPAVLVYLHGVADPAARIRIERYVRELSHVEAAVTGDDLIALGLEPSEAFSDILRRSLDDRLDELAVGREAEMENLRRLARGAGAAD